MANPRQAQRTKERNFFYRGEKGAWGGDVVNKGSIGGNWDLEV